FQIPVVRYANGEARARESLRRRGVEVRERTMGHPHRRRQRTRGRRVLPAESVVWAAGVAASPVMRTIDAAVDRAGRVLVEPDLSIPGHPEVFVIGDTAAFAMAASRCQASRR